MGQMNLFKDMPVVTTRKYDHFNDKCIFIGTLDICKRIVNVIQHEGGR